MRRRTTIESVGGSYEYVDSVDRKIVCNAGSRATIEVECGRLSRARDKSREAVTYVKLDRVGTRKKLLRMEFLMRSPVG